MGRGEGPVQRRHRRQLCERVQYVRERVSGKSVRRRVPGGRVGRGAGEPLGGRPQRAHRRGPRPPFPRRPCAGPPAPVGSYLSPPPRPRNSPPHSAQRGAPQPGRSLGAARSFPGAGGRDGGFGGASWGPGACTIVDARGLVTLAPAAPGARPLLVLLGAGLVVPR